MKQNRHSQVILFFGLQGSGKGTQAAFISRKFGIPTLSSGAVLREEIVRGSKFGKLVARFVTRGKLVPNGTMNKIIRTKLSAGLCRAGIILDGYPRNLAQAKGLESFCPVDSVVLIQISDREALRRLRGRQICSVCGENYHATERPSKSGNLCERCGGKLVIRADDTPSAIRRRLHTYHKETEPVIEYYRKKGVLLEVDGGQEITLVNRGIERILGLSTAGG